MRRHNVISSLLLLLILSLEDRLVGVLHVLHGLHLVLTIKLPIEISCEVILLQLVLLEGKHCVVHVFVAATATVAALRLLHLGHLLLRLGLRNYFVEVLVRVVQYDNRRARLLALVHHLHLLTNYLVLLFFVEYLVLLANLLHDVKVD